MKKEANNYIKKKYTKNSGSLVEKEKKLHKRKQPWAKGPDANSKLSWPVLK